MAQLVEALCYKPEGCRFDSRWRLWNFSLTQYYRPHYYCGIGSSSKRNDYKEYFMYELKTLPPSCGHCIEIWESQLLGTLRVCIKAALLHFYRFHIKGDKRFIAVRTCLSVLYETVLSTTSMDKIFRKTNSSLNKDGVIDHYHLF